MSLDDDRAVDREIVGWRKVINVAGPGFSDTIKVTDEDQLGLEPKTIEVDGLVFERYGDEEEYVEVRRDYVVARSVYPLYKIADEKQESDLDVGVTSDMLDELDRQERSGG